MDKSARVGIVLSSGGIRGVFAHTGFMQAIERLQIPISAAAGCSAGALVGGYLASGTPMKDWTATLADTRSSDFWSPDSALRLGWKLIARRGRGYTGLSSPEPSLRFTRRNIAATRFEDCLYPFHVLAINLATGNKQVFSSGELAPRMTASAAIPILYEPIVIDGDYYCDGAAIDFAPTDAICCRHKLDLVIVHHVAQQFGDRRELEHALKGPWAMLEVVDRLVFRYQPWYLTGEPLAVHQCPCGCGAIIMVLEPALPSMRWPSIANGDDVRRLTDSQTETLLRPWLDAMLTDPRSRMPPLSNDAVPPTSGCGVAAG